MEESKKIMKEILKSIPFKMVALKYCGCGRKPTDIDMFTGVVYGKEINGNPVQLADETGAGINSCITCRREQTARIEGAKIAETTDKVAWDKFRRVQCGKTDGEILTARNLQDYKFNG